MRPDGDPVTVYPSGDGKPSWSIEFDDIAVGPHLMAFARSEVTGNIWLLEPAKGAK